MQLADALERFVTSLRELRTSGRTIEAYAGYTRRILGDRTDWDKPGMAAVLRTWRKELQRRYAAGEVSDSTVRGSVAALKRFYAWCVDNRLVSTNPAVDLESVGSALRLPRPMPLDAVRKLIEVIPKENIRDRAIIELFLNGLRNVEVCRMDFGWLTVVQEEGTICARVIGKGNIVGDVMLSPSCAQYLGTYVVQRLAGELWREYIPDAESFLQGVDRCLRQHLPARNQPVFEINGHRPLRQNLNLLFNQYRDKADLPSTFGPHSLRHTCGTELIESGVDVRVVQEILRHRNIAQTVRYTQIRRGPKAAAMRRLPNFGGVHAG